MPARGIVEMKKTAGGGRGERASRAERASARPLVVRVFKRVVLGKPWVGRAAYRRGTLECRGALVTEASTDGVVGPP